MRKRVQQTDLTWLAAVVAIVVGVTCVAIFTPSATIDKLASLIGRLPDGALASIGVAVSGAAVAIWRSRQGGPPSPPMLPVLALLGLTLAGCGASAIRTHATASTVAAVTLDQGRRALVAETRESIAACSGDRACLDAAEARIAPLGVAFDAVRLAAVAHREAVEAAHVAGDGDAVGLALGRAWHVLADEWPSFLAMLQAAGVDVGALMPLPEVE